MEVALLVIGALLGLFLQVFFQDSLASLAIRFVGPIVAKPRVRNLGGLWFSYYEIIKTDESPVLVGSPLNEANIGRVKFSHVGRSIVGRNVRSSRSYFLRLHLEDACWLTGTWRDQSGGRHHFGGVQLWWNYNGKHLSGKFIGRDRHNNINHGLWVFARNENDLQGLADASRSQLAARKGKPVGQERIAPGAQQ